MISSFSPVAAPDQQCGMIVEALEVQMTSHHLYHQSRGSVLVLVYGVHPRPFHYSEVYRSLLIHHLVPMASVGHPHQ